MFSEKKTKVIKYKYKYTIHIYYTIIVIGYSRFLENTSGCGESKKVGNL